MKSITIHTGKNAVRRNRTSIWSTNISSHARWGKDRHEAHGGNSNGWYHLIAVFSGIVAAGWTNVTQNEDIGSTGITAYPDKPFYRKHEIASHTTKEKGIWITYENGVYDITNFIVNHPGGQDKIVLAAGGAVEPFWAIYRQHYNSKLAKQHLAPLLIGYIHPDDVEVADSTAVVDDPYANDPVVSPVQVFHQRKPVNSETPSTLLSDTWLTPEQFWFKRNHHPVPQMSADTYRLTVVGLGVKGGEVVLSLDDLKSKFSKVKVVAAIQCGGNRRSEMNEVAITAGSPWGTSAISNAEWAGVRLRDVLKAALVDAGVGAAALDEEALMEEGVRHVQFAAAEGLEASIPLHKALSICK